MVEKKKNTGKRNTKIHSGISYFIKISILIAIVLSFYERNWMNVFVSILTFILIILPKLFEKKYRIVLPLEFQTIILIFIYASVFLGGVAEFYHVFWWWDSLMHAFSGLALGFAGFLILYSLNKSQGKFNASPFWIAVFSFCFALSLGALWEIFEFIVDHFLGYDMQRARFSIETIKAYSSTRIAIYDTMWDLILDALGALVASVSGYLYLIKKKIPVFTKFVKSFEEINPNLFE